MVIITRLKARSFSRVPERPQHRLLLLIGKSRQSKMVWHIFDLRIIPWKNMAVGRSNFWTSSLSLDRRCVSTFRMAKCLTCSSTMSIFSAITVQVRLHFIFEPYDFDVLRHGQSLQKTKVIYHAYDKQGKMQEKPS